MDTGFMEKAALCAQIQQLGEAVEPGLKLSVEAKRVDFASELSSLDQSVEAVALEPQSPAKHIQAVHRLRKLVAEIFGPRRTDVVGVPLASEDQGAASPAVHATASGSASQKGQQLLTGMTRTRLKQATAHQTDPFPAPPLRKLGLVVWWTPAT